MNVVIPKLLKKPRKNFNIDFSSCLFDSLILATVFKTLLLLIGLVCMLTSDYPSSPQNLAFKVLVKYTRKLSPEDLNPKNT